MIVGVLLKLGQSSRACRLEEVDLSFLYLLNSRFPYQVSIDLVATHVILVLLIRCYPEELLELGSDKLYQGVKVEL